MNSYIDDQERLIKSCDDFFIKTDAISIYENYGFVEWTMCLVIMVKEFIYPRTTRLIFSDNGLIQKHREYFDFCGPKFGPIPILVAFTRLLYKQFVS